LIDRRLVARRRNVAALITRCRADRIGAAPGLVLLTLIASGACSHVTARSTAGPAASSHAAVSRPTGPSASSPGGAATAPPSGTAALLARLPSFAAPPVPVPIAVTARATAPIYSRLPVTQPVAFLTMDDGIVQDPVDLTMMRAAHIRFTMFLIGPVAAKNPAFFRELVADGGVIEDHTLTHPILRGRPYAYQRHEICGAKTLLTNTFGPAPVLFRPPFGDYDANTLRAVHDCGLRAAFFWSETVRNGKVFYQTSVHRIRAGDILLMHFRDTFPQDLLAALNAIHQAGLTPALLTDYGAPRPRA
jgi:peptidoglycan/xylan/chitin deacetylase (PgdA/CDA1 family)